MRDATHIIRGQFRKLNEKKRDKIPEFKQDTGTQEKRNKHMAGEIEPKKRGTDTTLIVVPAKKKVEEQKIERKKEGKSSKNARQHERLSYSY